MIAEENVMSHCTREEIIEYKTLGIASYIVLHHATIRMAAAAYCIPKSTAHSYIHTHLPRLDSEQYNLVCTILNENWADRARRGGIANGERHRKA